MWLLFVRGCAEGCVGRRWAGQALEGMCSAGLCEGCVGLCCSIWGHKGHGINSWRVAAAWERAAVGSALGGRVISVANSISRVQITLFDGFPQVFALGACQKQGPGLWVLTCKAVYIVLIPPGILV